MVHYLSLNLYQVDFRIYFSTICNSPDLNHHTKIMFSYISTFLEFILCLSTLYINHFPAHSQRQSQQWCIILLLITNPIKYKLLCKTSHPQVICKKVAYKNFTKFQEKNLCWSLFFSKVAGLNLQLYLKWSSYSDIFYSSEFYKNFQAGHLFWKTSANRLLV